MIAGRQSRVHRFRFLFSYFFHLSTLRLLARFRRRSSKGNHALYQIPVGHVPLSVFNNHGGPFQAAVRCFQNWEVDGDHFPIYIYIYTGGLGYIS